MDYNKKRIIAAILLLVAGVLLIYTSFELFNKFLRENEKVKHVVAIDYDALKKPLKDNSNLYSIYPREDVVSLYITALTGNSVKDGRRFTLDDINNIGKKIPGIDDPVIDIIVREGKDGKDFGNGLLGHNTQSANATMTVRGQSARIADKKSYKIKLFEDAGKWREQRVLNLNKHYFDITRIKQKFCFDYISNMPDMVSFRTTFVHLYIKDVAKSNDAQYVDYGLYTHTEQPDDEFLKAHGLDQKANLYQPMDFEFHRSEDIIMPSSDPRYDYEAMEKLIKIKSGSSTDRLAQMLAEVNNNNLEFEKVFNKYFDRNNYLTWLAMNILFDNYDTMSRNYLLYNPLNSNTFYFLPWDYDKTMITETKEHYAFFGISRYWGTVLHRRFFRNPINQKALTEKVDMLMGIMTPDRTKQYTEAYSKIASEFLSRLPDGNEKHLAKTAQVAVDTINNLQAVIENNYKKYKDSLEQPMPVFLGVPKKNPNGGWSFNWDPSYDMQEDMLKYSFYISTTYDFKAPLISMENLLSVKVDVPPLPPGKYYWKVLIKDSKGNTQIPFDYTIEKEVGYVFGTRELIVE